MPPELVQLGVAGVVAIVLAWLLKLILDGRLHTDAEIEVLDEQVKDRDSRIDALLKQNETLSQALTASNDQSRAIINLWKALGSNEGDG